MGDLPEKIDLSDVGLFAHGIPHEIFRHLRGESPIYWNEEACGSGFWALTRYADVLAVGRDPETFSSERRGIMIFDESFETSGRERMMIEMDPPRHTRLRTLINRGMTPRRVLDLEGFARRSFEGVLDRSLELGRCDFVNDVATLLPLQIIAELVGIPQADRPLLGALADRVQGFEDPELGGGDGENTDAIRQMSAYALDLARDRRRKPKDDIATAILQADLDGESMSDEAFAAFFLLLITGGIETTKAAISGGMLALTEHPDQWAALRRDPDALPGAIEEMIRWVTPIHHFRRTATRDTVISGQPIQEDDKVVIWYSSANRDESVFDDPFRFDITRTPNEHLSFGFGRHFCLGANLARLEIRVAFEALLARGVEVERCGEIDHLLSSFTNSLKRMPVEMRAT
ncbi:MAG: cytochrome P450 [bacterium]|nr:cytochrome P450 [Deltaproteobacteria bacterium]MCP4908296.1 cytochrome P450 [bacterium]